MKVLLVASVIPEYRIPALNAWSELPGVSLNVFATKGGDWATARSAKDLSLLAPPVEFLDVSLLKLGGTTLVRFTDLRDRVRELQPDVVVAEPRMGLLSLIGLVLWPVRTNHRPVPVVWWLAGWRNMNRSRLVIWLSELMTSVVVRRGAAAATYSSMAAQRARALGLPSERVLVAQNAVDVSRLQRSLTGRRRDFDGELRMLFVGQVLKIKRLDVVIRALASDLPGCRAARLRVVGSGDGVPELARSTDELGVQDRVEWLPATYDPKELAAHLEWADVGVLPHAGGLMINTCMAAGLPVAVGRADGTELDLVVPGRTGWVLDADEQTYADWIREQSACGDRLRTIGSAAKLHLESVATLEKMVERLTDACRLAAEVARA